MTDFSQRLKDLRKNANMNQAHLAKAIGLTQTAIANYESGSRFPNEEKLLKLAELFGISLDMLMGRENYIGISCLSEKYITQTPDGQFFISLGDDITQMLMDGRKQDTMDLILSLPAQGIFIQEIYHKLFQYILYKVGWLWESGVIDVTKEHYISQTLEQLMPILMQEAPKKSKHMMRVICFTPEGEEHVLVNHMISDFLDIEGFESLFLGRNIPLKDLISCIEREQPVALVISVTLSKNIPALQKLIEGLANHPMRKTFKIIIGGNPLNGYSASLGADAIGSSLEDTVEKVKALTGITIK